MDYYKLLTSVDDYEKICICINDKIYTYNDVINDSIKLEESIKENMNISDKEIVAIFDENLYFQLISFFALNKAKMVPLIIHPSTPYKEVEEIMKVNRIKYLLDSRGIKKIYLDKNEKLFNLSNCTNAVLTSGSTGLPKVLLRTYESWAGFFENQNEVFSVNNNTILFFHGPLSFTGNLNSILSVIYEGGTLVTYEGFNPLMWQRLIRKCNVNTMYMVPAKIIALNKSLKEPIKSIKSIFTGSQQLFGNLKFEMKKYYSNASIILYYGASELNYITYITLDELIKNPLSVGKPFKGVKVKIKDEYIYVMSNYFVQGFKGWCSVKDKGYISKNGELIFNGREEEIINKGGNTINLKRILSKIRKLSYINNAFVTSYNDQSKEKEIVAFIETNKYITKFQFKKDLKDELLTYEMPKKVFILDKIPLNDSGKINKRELKFKFNI